MSVASIGAMLVTGLLAAVWLVTWGVAASEWQSARWSEGAVRRKHALRGGVFAALVLAHVLSHTSLGLS